MKLKAEQIFEKGTIIKENKTKFLVENLIKYINKTKENDILPDKKEVSSLLGVSIGTVQNAYRTLEDFGLVKSKQRVGTVITSENIKKQTSKRDCCVSVIKEYMKRNDIDEISALPSIRKLSKELDYSASTINSALKNIEAGNFSEEVKNTTLVEKIEKEIEQYIENNCKIGDNIPSLKDFSKLLNVSIKTVHDAVKILSDKRILTPHRGRYGTVVINMPNNIRLRKEDLIFASAGEAEFYFYEKIQNHIKQLIIRNNYEVGSKLPAIRDLAAILNVNKNTVRHALKSLEYEGYVASERGRYGGTFVTNIPDAKAFKWLALSPKYTVFDN